MPKVKTITPGRLSGLSTLTSELASDISQQKEREYLKAVSDWEEEKAKLDAIKEDQLNYIDQKMQLIAGMDQLAGETFDDTFKENLMNDVKNYASIVSDIKLGNIDATEGYMKLAKYDKKLTDLQTAIPNINTLASKVNDAINKEDGEVGAMIHDGTGDTYNIAKILHDLYHPSRNGNVSYQTIDGQDFIVHKDGQKISIPGLNAIMSGNNPDYPISFAESPDEALGQLYDAMWRRAGNGEYYKKDVITEKIVNGKKRRVKERRYDIADNSQFSKDLKETVAPMIDDQDKMRVIWNNIGGDGKWENDEDQRKQAITLLHNRARDLYAPTSNVLIVETTLPTSTGSKTKPKSTTDIDDSIDYSALYNANKAFMEASEEATISNFIETSKKINKAKKDIQDFMNQITGKRRFRSSGSPVIADIKVELIDENKPELGYTIQPFKETKDGLKDLAGVFEIRNIDDLKAFENLLIPLGRSITVGTKNNKSPNNDTLPSLTKQQASQLKEGDKFILTAPGDKFDGKKFVMRIGQDGKLEALRFS